MAPVKSFRAQSTSEQLTEFLREEIRSGRLAGEMPGIKQLVKTHGVNSVSTTKAVQQLEKDGLILYQGGRRKRLIAKEAVSKPHYMRVGVLHYDEHDFHRSDVLQLRQSLTDAGHTPVVALKTMEEMGMSTQRIIRHMKPLEVDAWIIYAGSFELLQWVAEQDIPAFAIYGRMNSVDMAGMGIVKSAVTESLINQLVELGHRRIVLLVREERRKPNYGLPERLFVEQLQAHDIPTGPYNIPDWEDSPEGLEECLNKLFAHTPPTALLIGDPLLFHAVHSQLARRGIKAPENISLYCNDYNASFEWCRPSVAHLTWDYRPTIRRVLQWVKNTSQGQRDKKKSFTKAKFVEGDTIGPPPQ